MRFQVGSLLLVALAVAAREPPHRRKLRGGVGRSEHMDQKGATQLTSLGLGAALGRIAMNLNVTKAAGMMQNLSPEERKAKLAKFAAARKAHKDKMEKRRQEKFDAANLWFWQRWWKSLGSSRHDKAEGNQGSS